MYGDYSRLTGKHARKRHYASVLLQQGRVHLDADWNELVNLTSERTEIAMTDIIGHTGAPKQNAGFRIVRNGNSFNISKGRYYVDGVLVENDVQVSYENQINSVAQPELTDLLSNGESGIVYLDVWKEDVSALEDIRLREPALGGPDTANRQAIAWRVGVQPLNEIGLSLDEIVSRAELGEEIWASGNGGMSAGTSVPEVLPDDTDCLLSPEAGYLSQDNLLYRVEIHKAGTRSQAKFKWSRENGSVLALLDKNSTGDFILRGSIEDDELGFSNNSKVEVFDDIDRHLGRAGLLRRMLRGDNNTVTFPDGLGRSFDEMLNPRVRLWNQKTTSSDNGLAINSSPIKLENGIEIAFDSGNYSVGDYWLIPARAATGTIEWPPSGLPAAGLGGALADADSSAPFGWGRHRVPLAFVERSGNGLSSQNTDLRPLFPSLTQLEAVDVRFDNSKCELDADNVQEAIEALCSRGQGHCSIYARNTSELLAALDNLSNINTLHICLAEGDFILDEPLSLSGFRHLRITGAGSETLITASSSEVAIAIQGCSHVEMYDLRARGQQASGDNKKQRRGAITIKESDNILLERVFAECSWAKWREQSCLSVYGNRNTSNIVIRDCHLSVGQGQIGIQITNSNRVIIENNFIKAVAPNSSTVTSRFSRDNLLIRRIVAGAIALPNSNRDRSSMIRSIRTRLNVATASGSANLVIVTHPSLVEPINDYLQLRGNNLSIGNDLELFTHLRKALARAIRENGSYSIDGRQNNKFSSFVHEITGRTTAYCDDGIVVAGASLGEVHIRGNDIKGAINGVRIAASHNNNPNPPNWKRVQPENTAERVIVENNSIVLHPVAPTNASNGIHVGHVDSLIIRGNRIDFILSNPNADQSYWSGVRIYGWRGALMRIVENTVRNARIGISVRPNTEPESGQHWDIVHNGFDNVTEMVEAGGSINTGSHN